METIEPFTLEKNIKLIFNNKFKLIAGYEYFEGDEETMKKEFLKIKSDHDKKIEKIEKIDVNNYEDKKIISKDILINKNKINEDNIFYEKLNDVFLQISAFYRYKNNINMTTKEICNNQITNLYDETVEIYNNTIIEIKNDLLENDENIDMTNDIINYIILYKNIIIDTINLHFYDENLKWYLLPECNVYSYEKSLCDFLGTYDKNYSFLTYEHINDLIKNIHEKYFYYEIIKESKNKYSGITLVGEKQISFISNVDFDYDYIITNYCNGIDSVFYNEIQSFCNENDNIKEHLEGFLHKIDFYNISNYSLYKKDDGEFKKIIYSLIIKSSVKDKFSQKITSFIQNNKNLLNSYKDKCEIKKIKKNKNLKLFIENFL